MSNLPSDIQLSMLKLLANSWCDIEYDYSGLTREERKCISRDHFDHLVELMVAEGLIQ